MSADSLWSKMLRSEEYNCYSFSSDMQSNLLEQVALLQVRLATRVALTQETPTETPDKKLQFKSSGFTKTS